MIKKGSWVQIEKIILNPDERPQNLPDSTKKTPYKLWVNGFLTKDADIGEEVEIKTMIGRKIKGKLVMENPRYDHNFGTAPLELLNIK